MTQISPLLALNPAGGVGCSDPGPVADQIFLRDYIVKVEIGAFQQERGVTQRLRFTLVADLAARDRSVGADDVDAILSYDILLDAVDGALSGARLNLLETLAEAVAGRVLAHAGVARVQVRIEKLDRCSGALGVEISRSRPAILLKNTDQETGRARVLVLGPSLLGDTRLPEVIDALVTGQGAVLCADAQFAVPVAVQAPQAQRQIDLLAMGQAAWALAARDPRCAVVESRTELDWALRHDKVVVWAPAKMIADAGEKAPPAEADLPALALWLADVLGAAQLELAGDVNAPAPTDRVAILRREVDLGSARG